MRGLIVILLAACGGPPALHPVVAPVVPRATFAVAPEQLGMPGAMARLPYRTRLAGYGRGRGRVTVRADGRPSDLPEQELHWHHHDPGDGAGRVLPVIGQSAAMIRVVEDNDHARFALWIARDDVQLAITAPIQLADARGLAPVDTGVWLAAGAPVEPGNAAGTLRAVTVLDDALELRGYVAVALIDQVWRDTPDAPGPRGAMVRVPGDTIIRSAPDGAPIARVTDHVVGTVVATRERATLVEVHRPFVRVRGWVPSAALVPGAPEPVPPAPSAPRLEYAAGETGLIVPAGTCLYDAREGGEVIGVQLEREGRWGASTIVGWDVSYVESTWAQFDAYLKIAGGTLDTPTWEACPRTAPRRTISLP